MKQYLLLLTFWLCLGEGARAQQCNIDFTTQAQVNAFPATGCTTVTNISISGGSASTPGGIYDLSPLSTIREVTGSVSLYLNDLASIEGLGNIKNIAGSLIISGAKSPNVLPINGFASLETVGVDVLIVNNPSLAAISGFPLLRSARNVTITGAGLVNILGFNSLKSINALRIYQCSALRSVTGFANLTTLQLAPTLPESILGITDNPLLEEIPEFPSLSAAVMITIQNNNLLKKIAGFNKLKTLAGLYLVSNASLTTISGFNGELVLDGTASLNNNPKMEAISGFAGLRAKSLYIGTNAGLLTMTGFEGSKLGNVSISSNAALKSIIGFTNSEATEYIQLDNNSKLDNISGFKGVSAPKTITVSSNPLLASLAEAFIYPDYTLLSTLNLTGNSKLSACSLSWICSYLRRGGYAVISNNGAGCTSQAILQNCQALGVQAAATPTPTDYPNPVSDVFHLDAPTRYQVYDLLGRTLLRGEGDEFSMAGLPNGVYVVGVGTKPTRSVRLIKQ